MTQHANDDRYTYGRIGRGKVIHRLEGLVAACGMDAASADEITLVDLEGELEITCRACVTKIAAAAFAEREATMTPQQVLDDAIQALGFDPDDPWDHDKREPLAAAAGAAAAKAYYDAIQAKANNTERSEQARKMMIGVSTLGHCRNFAALMIKEAPFSDRTDKTAAFIGTVLGDAIEAQLAADHPDWLIQQTLVFALPSGGTVAGHADVIIPSWAEDPENGIFQGVWDGKSKNGLETVKATGQSQQQRYQLHAYAAAAIDAGYLDPERPILVGDVFFDRGGADVTPFPLFEVFDRSVVDEVDSWINDVKYAVIHGEDAARDMPRDWCYSWCEYATTCRGRDTDVSGLIQSEDALNAVKVYQRGADLVKAGERMKKAAQRDLEGVEGSTGTHTVRSVFVNESVVPETIRKAHVKIDIRRIAGAKEDK